MKKKWLPLIDRLRSRSAHLGVVGLGYVGLPAAVGFARAGYPVVGVDSSTDRIAEVVAGSSGLVDVDDDVLTDLIATSRLSVSDSYAALAGIDAVLICVPTPLRDGGPDLRPITAAGTSLGEVLSPDTLVILESTTFPGTTEEVLLPLLESETLRCGRDFLLAFSPERIDPGNPTYSFSDIPKIVGGVTDDSTRAAEALFEQVVPKVVPVSSPREAEMAKLIENTYRHVNIALINELAVYAHELGIDIWEAIEAAATKPFGFMPFWPSPGWGGHCIPLDPSYLSWSVRKHRSHEVRFVELAQAVASEMPRHVLERVASLLNETGKAVRDSRILGLGVAYKGGTEDVRHSPGTRILAGLASRGARISFHDPLVPEADIGGKTKRSVALTKKRLADTDLVIVFVPQTGIDWELVRASAPLVFDCCNALRTKGRNIHRL